MHAVNPVASDTNARAKTHPLFPVLEYIASQVQEIGKQQRLHSKRLTRMENLIEDQGKLIEKYHRNAFSLKEEHLEVSIMHSYDNYIVSYTYIIGTIKFYRYVF